MWRICLDFYARRPNILEAKKMEPSMGKPEWKNEKELQKGKKKEPHLLLRYCAIFKKYLYGNCISG